jgi:hypothetical protein
MSREIFGVGANPRPLRVLPFLVEQEKPVSRKAAKTAKRFWGNPPPLTALPFLVEQEKACFIHWSSAALLSA